MNDNSRTARAIEEIRRWATIVLLVLVVVLGYQVSELGRTVDHLTASSQRTEVSANDASAAATAAKTTLEAAIAQSKNGAVNADAVRDALQSIHRIEVAVCGHPCPEPGG